MSQFNTQLVLRVLSSEEIKGLNRDLGVQLYEVVQPFAFDSDCLNHPILVPAGFITDLASIPKLAWNILPPDDPTIFRPSVLHDYLYSCMGLLPDGFIYARKQADGVLLEGMLLCGARSEIRSLVYHAVELFGGSHWKA